MASKLCVSISMLALCGCAAQRTANQVASASASILNDYRRELGSFADRQNALNANNQRELADLRELSGERLARINERILSLRLAGDKEALEMYGYLTAPPAQDILSSTPVLNSLQPANPPAKLAVDTAKAAAIVKQLKALQQTKPLLSRVFGLIEYRDKLAETYRKSLQQAEGAADKAQAESAKAAADVTGGKKTLENQP